MSNYACCLRRGGCMSVKTFKLNYEYVRNVNFNTDVYICTYVRRGGRVVAFRVYIFHIRFVSYDSKGRAPAICMYAVIHIFKKVKDMFRCGKANAQCTYDKFNKKNSL